MIKGNRELSSQGTSMSQNEIKLPPLKDGLKQSLLSGQRDLAAIDKTRLTNRLSLAENTLSITINQTCRTFLAAWGDFNARLVLRKTKVSRDAMSRKIPKNSRGVTTQGGI